MQRFVIGIDEAGRGPLAGPVAVGLIAAPLGFDIKRAFPNVADSKKLSPEVREAIYAQIEVRASMGEIKFCARFTSAHYIDEYGITSAVARAIRSGLRRLEIHHSQTELVMLDGLLKAPPHYAQETIINGDDLVPIISLASIVAKVRRDRLMRHLSRKYPLYNFDQHKGYGTPMHREAINLYGLCDLHRRTYCKVDQDPEMVVL